VALLTVYEVSSADLTPAALTLATAASDGDTFVNDGRTVLQIRNAHGSASRTVTVDSVALSNFGTDVNMAYVVPANSTVIVGPFPPTRFNNGQGRVAVSYSDSAADVTIVPVSL